ncbi:MAG: N-acetylglucosamine-6-phosphate deacetylase [Ruminococcaceae bacterium]|nr:N-acetylglucosamine-6-phosphate deacetylase [Oscillospiraceae bacterium]
MQTLVKNGLVYQNASRKFLPLDILIENGKITAISQRGELDGVCAKVIDASNYRLTAGLIDVHTHGISGFDFLFADENALPIMSRAYLSHGVTTVMPTLASGTLDGMIRAAQRINDFKSVNGADFCGIHLEGRYLNPKKRGAHALELLKAPSIDELERFNLLNLKNLHISAAFELDNDKSFLNKALQIGATLSLGHTDATYSQACELETLGVTAYTHLYNAMPPLHHREGGTVAACLNGNSYGELICDGIHISPEIVNFTYKIKRDRLVLISDSMEATDCPDGKYSIAGNAVNVKDGVARTLDGALAGSTLTLDRALKNLMSFCNVSLEDAIINATEAPAKEVGIYGTYGSIDVGKQADMLFIDRNAFKIVNVVKSGEVISL